MQADKAKAGVSTQERILNAAETLFANHGISGTSVRSITAEAGVNLAAAHYHFGSKEELIRRVFARCIGPLSDERLRLLDDCLESAAGGPPDLQCIVEAFVCPAVRIGLDPSKGGQVFKRLIGRIHSEPGERISRIVLELFWETARRFQEALKLALPDLSQEQIAWRFMFMVGTMAMPLTASREVLNRVLGGELGAKGADRMVAQLVPFIVAGLRAPAPPIVFGESEDVGHQEGGAVDRGGRVGDLLRQDPAPFGTRDRS